MWPFKRKALTATPAVLDALGERGWQPYPLLGGGSRQRIQDAYNTAQSANYAWIYTNSPAVRTVVDAIVNNIGQLDLRLYEEISASKRQARPEHPAALSLRYPNEETSGDSFTRSMFKDFLLFDNVYALMEAAPGNQISLNRMPAHMIEVRGASMFRAEGYRFHRRDGTFVDFEPEQVLHWHGENPHDPRIGLSKLDALRSVIAEDAALQQALVELANSGLTEPTWVFRPLEAPEWSNQARKGFEEDLSNRVRRQNKTPVVLEEGMEMRSFGVSPKDAEMMQVRRWAIEQVARAYGVPLGMVGLAEDLEQARSQFYSDTLPPYCENYTRMLDQRVLVRVYGWTDGCFEFNLDEKHMGDDRITTLVSASGRAVMTTDEARARLNLPPIKGGNELVTPLNVLVGDNPKPSPMVMPPQQPGQPAQDGSAREEPKAMAVRGLLERLYERQARAYANKKQIDPDRFTRELAADLLLLTPGLNRRSVLDFAGGIHEALMVALRENSDHAFVFRAAHKNAGAVAELLITSLGMDMDLGDLRDLNVPNEILWERAGFSQDEIDRMRTIQLSDRLLLDASSED